MDALAVVLEKPEQLVLSRLDLTSPEAGDVVVDIRWSGISTGTERLLWSGRMPPFPGMGYPLVPGYESVGVVREAGPASGRRPGDFVFVPGARCFGEVRGLFGGAASRVVVAGARVIPVDEDLQEDAVLLALAATAYHAMAISIAGADPPASIPELIIGHGVLGRLLARLAVMLGDRPVTVWEKNPARVAGALGYRVLDPAEDERRDYSVICDVSGDASLLDELIARLAPGGEIVLAGFYHEPVSFSFPPAFMREARLRIAAEWRPDDMVAVRDLVASGGLSLAGLITHRHPAGEAADAYRTAFGDPACLKMVLDWKDATDKNASSGRDS
ncbi:chlorophyll synthesis pathway protein BchC [Lentisalinibacter salinarum]|uniref:chlorophyll synthesis pathway protein BchC n=1 Tax=Lentisalinibacter salinarum TaxID=2992239 RepID=UPI00387074A1